MEQQNTNYFLNDGCIANSLTTDFGIKKRFAVPHLSVLNKVNNDMVSNLSVTSSDITSTVSSLSSKAYEDMGAMSSEITANIGKLNGDVYLDMSKISSALSNSIADLDYDETIGVGKLVSSVTQVDGKISVATRDVGTGDVSSVALIPDDFIVNPKNPSFGKTNRIKFKYDKEGKSIILGYVHGGNDSDCLSVDCSDFIVDGMVKSVYYDKETNEIVITWNSDVKDKTIRIPMKDIFDVAILGSDYISIASESGEKSYRVSIKTPELFKEISSEFDYNNLYSYYQFLAGTGEWADKGAVKTLSDDISTLFAMGAKDLKFIGHIDSPEKLSTRTVVDYFRNGPPDLTSLLNGSYFPVKFADNSISVSTTDSVNPLVVGNGDVVIVHAHDDAREIAVDDLQVGTNLYVLKAGVSRYEYESEVRNTNCVSDFIDANFGNFPDKDAEIIEPRKSVSISSGLSAEDGFFRKTLHSLGGFYAASALVNNISSPVVSAKNITSDTLSAIGGNISTLNVVDETASSLMADSIFVKNISADNLSIDTIGLMMEDGVSKVITAIGETGGIVQISSGILEEKMVSGLTADLSRMSAVENALCAGLCSKVYIGNEPDGCVGYKDLSVIKITKSEYEALQPSSWNP